MLVCADVCHESIEGESIEGESIEGESIEGAWLGLSRVCVTYID